MNKPEILSPVLLRQNVWIAILMVGFYMVGFIGFQIPALNGIFVGLTKWALLLNALVLVWFDDSKIDFKLIAVLSFIFVAGFLIEVLGVNTGFVFGTYWYGDGLGVKLWNTPLMIGVNWLMLSYCFRVVLEKISDSVWLNSLLGGLGMLIYDLIMEQSAGVIDLWYWESGIIPLQNYVAWFLIAVVFQFFLQLSGDDFKNPLAAWSLICQFCFFFLLAIFS